MLCQSCKKAHATVHSIEIISGQKKEIHLCSECAKTKGIPIKPTFSVSDFLTNLIEGQLGEELETEEKAEELTCEMCGITYSEFKQLGRLGCPNDYKVFESQLSSLLERIHGHATHQGKVPNRAGKEIRKYKEIMELKQELDRAVAREDYEKAAELRDKITGLKKAQEQKENSPETANEEPKDEN